MNCSATNSAWPKVPTGHKKHDQNSGLGKVYTYWTRIGYQVLSDGTYYPHGSPHWTRQSFTETTTNDVMHIDYIEQGGDVNDGFVYSMLDKSQAFTHVCVERINDSVRAYVWAILGAQGQMRTSIVGEGTAFDAQNQFLINVQARIDHEVDPPTSVSTYQDVLHYARRKLDFVLGGGLYMVPSDMSLKINQIEDHNNEIVVSKADMSLGTYQELNPVSTQSVKSVNRAAALLGSSPDTNAVVPVVPTAAVPLLPSTAVVPPTVDEQLATRRHAAKHEETKTALIVGAVGVSLAVKVIMHALS